jgi:pullulanase/glycogen debranching enzyme
VELRGRGPDRRPGNAALRARQQRNFIATLLLSQGVPMLLAGDEIGRTQGGNNNAYCQDNAAELGRLGARTSTAALLAFTRRLLIALRARAPGVPPARLLPGPAAVRQQRARHPVAAARRRRDDAGGLGQGHARALGVFLSGEALQRARPRGRPVVDDSFLLLFNASHESGPLPLPADLAKHPWRGGHRQRRAAAPAAAGTSSRCEAVRWRGAVAGAVPLPRPCRPCRGAAPMTMRDATTCLSAPRLLDGRRREFRCGRRARQVGLVLPVGTAADDRSGRRLARAARDGRRCRACATPSASTAISPCPTRPRAATPTTCTRQRLTDPLAFDWPDAGWRGRPWHEAVIYELHVGCFTPAGTFAAAIERLDDLVALGITAIELMPVAEFPGRRGWGYDGVLLFAPDASYGTPDDLKRLVAAAHARG